MSTINTGDSSAQNIEHKTIDLEESDLFNLFHFAAEKLGFKGLYALEAGDLLFATYRGYSLFQKLKIEEFTEEDYEVSVSPTQLAELLEANTGIRMSARKINNLLNSLGFQVKSLNQWLPTELGKRFAVTRMVARKGYRGFSRQLKWKVTVLSEILKAVQNGK
jgi:hypothetical protein